MRRLLALLIVIICSSAFAQSGKLSIAERLKLIEAMKQCFSQEAFKSIEGAGAGSFGTEVSGEVGGVFKKLVSGEAEAKIKTKAALKARIVSAFEAVKDPQVQMYLIGVCYQSAFNEPAQPAAAKNQATNLTTPKARAAKSDVYNTAPPMRGERMSKCHENEKCHGEVVYCALAGDDRDGEAGRLAENTSQTPISYGEWSNEECDARGTGWHVYAGSCGKGKGSKFKRCKYVFTKLTEEPMAASHRLGRLAHGEPMIRCHENEECHGKVKYCALTGDDKDGAANRLMESTSQTPVSYGEWFNTECDTRGTGWHAYAGSCGTNKGTKFKRCKFVFIENSSQ